MEASLPEKTLITEKETPESVQVATEELDSGKVGEEHIPLEWLEEEIGSDFDEVEHFKLNKL